MIHYDSQSDVFYVGIKRGTEEEWREVAPGVSVELDENSEVIGIEILNASQILRPVIKQTVSSVKQKVLQAAVA